MPVRMRRDWERLADHRREVSSPFWDQLWAGDNLERMRAMPPRSVDLVFCSPPYEAARTYGVDFVLRGEEWVAWALERFRECLRVCRGLVVWVIEGQTRLYSYSAAPLLLAADLKRSGVNLRKPPIYGRYSVPGSGGPDWLRNDYEFCLSATAQRGMLPWSDNTACGHPPKYAPGGEMSNRKADGRRVNQWGASSGTTVDSWGEGANGEPRPKLNQWGMTGDGVGARMANGERDISPRPSHRNAHGVSETTTRRRTGGDASESQGGFGQEYGAPVLANPGNVIWGSVGGNQMGSKLAHENEAPFPLWLAEFFVRSYCPPDGLVLDPFMGSGTTADAAKRWGRHFLGIDLRPSQVDLAARRLDAITWGEGSPIKKATKKRRRKKGDGPTVQRFFNLEAAAHERQGIQVEDGSTGAVADRAATPGRDDRAPAAG